MRFSDIFKGGAAGNPPTPPPPAPAAPAASPQTPPASLPPAKSPPPFSVPPPPSPAPPAASPPPKARLEAAAQAQEAIRHFFEAVLQGHPLLLTDLKKAASALSPEVAQNEQVFIEVALLPGSEDYFLAHALNTGIFSIVLAHAARYTPDRIEQTALAAFLHDVGLLKLRSLIDQPRTLTSGELKEVHKHPRLADDLLKTVPDLPRLVLAVAMECNEKLDGSGYPAGLKGGEISEEARLVGLCCSFEAATHSRPYRSSRQAVSTVLEELKLLSGERRRAFDPQFLKLFLERVGPYPKGSWVQLSTGEQAIVVMSTPEFPLRPMVDVWVDVYGRAYPEPKRLDLKDHPVLYVNQSFGMERPKKEP